MEETRFLVILLAMVAVSFKHSRQTRYMGGQLEDTREEREKGGGRGGRNKQEAS